MGSSQSNLAGNLAKGLRKGKCNYCKSCFDYLNAEVALLVFKFVAYNKNF